MCRTLLNRRARRDASASAPAPPRCAASGASQGSPSDASTTSSSGQTDRSGSHGSASRSTPAAAATAPLTSRPGNGNSTFAHTPSPRPGEAPSTTDSRCVSQRSTPRVGTATTSACRGSASGAPMHAGEAHPQGRPSVPPGECETRRRPSSGRERAFRTEARGFDCCQCCSKSNRGHGEPADAPVLVRRAGERAASGIGVALIRERLGDPLRS